MMMSPLNILSAQSQVTLSNSSSTNSTLESVATSNSNRSPDNCSHHSSKSPPSPTLPTANSILAKDSSSVASMAANNAAAASLLHAAIAAGNVPAMSSTLAQMFPGSFPLHVAAAAAAAFYGNSNGASQPSTQSSAGAPNAYLYAQQQQHQQLSSLLANAARMTPNAFLGIQSGKKLSDLSESKLSPTQSQSGGHGAHHSPNAVLSGLYNNQTSTPSSNRSHHHHQSSHPMMPLTNMMGKQAPTGHVSPQTDTASTSSSRSSSGHHMANSSNSSLLSPVLFSPIAAHQTSDTNTNLAFSKHRKAMLDVVGSEVASTTAESPYTANYHRIAQQTPSSPPMGQSGPNTSANGSNMNHTTTTTNQQVTNGSSVRNNNGVLHCPICSISLDGVDINQHFFEEMHKIDSMRKLPDWSNESQSNNDECNNGSNETGNHMTATNAKQRRQESMMNKAEILSSTGFDAMNGGKFPLGPPQQQHSSSSSSSSNTTNTSYQKKLQLPQSRWETFQRIRQNRHARLAAFMRLTRRKYEAAYESTLQQHQQQNAPNGVATGANTVGPAFAHQTPGTAPFGQSSGSGPSTGGGAHHPHHHSPSIQHQQRSPNILASHHAATAAPPSSHPHHPHQPHPFELFGKSVGSKISPNSESSHRGNMLHSPENGPIPRTSPASLSAAAAAYQAHSLFAQNPAFLHSTLPFYPYHSAVAFPPGYGAFPGGPESFFNGSIPLSSSPSCSSISTNTATQQPKIWRSVDTDQLEADDEHRTKDEDQKTIRRSNSNDDLVGRCNADPAIDVVTSQQSSSTGSSQALNNHSTNYAPDHHSISPASSVHSIESNKLGGGSSHHSEDNINNDHNTNNIDALNLKKQSNSANSDNESEDHLSNHTSHHQSDEDLIDEEIVHEDGTTAAANKSIVDGKQDADHNSLDEDETEVDVVSAGSSTDHQSIHQQQPRSSFQLNHNKNFKRHYADVYHHEEMLTNNNRKRPATFAYFQTSRAQMDNQNNQNHNRDSVSPTETSSAS